ncbi:MAG TPA: hypothetical protein VI319_16040 [Burkholderiales bacterium]
MALRIHLEHRDGCAVVRVEGEWEMAGAMRTLRALIDTCRRDGIARVLIDTRDVAGNVPILDRSDIGKIMANTQGPPIAFAVVCRPERVTPERFLQVVANNRGGTVKVVTEPGEGFLWLQQQRRAA